jgi:hypothetical protein
VAATKPEGQAVAAFVRDTLVADTGAGGVNTLLGGRIYRDQVPQPAILPALIIDAVRWVPLNTMSGTRVAAACYLSVHLIADGTDYAAINTVAARANVVVHGSSGSNGGVTIVKLENIEPDLAYPEDEAGRAYRHLVLSYRTPAYAV